MYNVMITGANQGIGQYLVEQLLKDGNQVAVFDSEIDTLKKLQEHDLQNLLYFDVDVRSGDALHKAVVLQQIIKCGNKKPNRLKKAEQSRHTESKFDNISAESAIWRFKKS